MLHLLPTSLHDLLDSEIVSMGDKAIRHSFDRPLPDAPIRMVRASANINHLVFPQATESNRSNEITAIHTLLKPLDLTVTAVTIDGRYAMSGGTSPRWYQHREQGTSCPQRESSDVLWGCDVVFISWSSHSICQQCSRLL